MAARKPGRAKLPPPPVDAKAVGDIVGEPPVPKVSPEMSVTVGGEKLKPGEELTTMHLAFIAQAPDSRKAVGPSSRYVTVTQITHTMPHQLLDDIEKAAKKGRMKRAVFINACLEQVLRDGLREPEE